MHYLERENGLKRSMFKILSITLLLSLAAKAEINPNAQSNDINVITNEIGKIKLEIQKIDNSLVLKNKEYLETMAKRQSLDLEMYDIEVSLNSSIQLLETKKTELDLLLKKALITSITENDSEELMRNQILIKRSKIQKNELMLQIENEKKLQSTLMTLKSQFDEKVNVERDLYDVVNKLEAQKSVVVKKYLEFKDKESTVRSKISASRVAAKASQAQNLEDLKADFISPINTYLSKEHQEKGITFNVKNNENILAAKAGKVIHSGVLANYGNVMIIDHGNDIRSIYLGDISPSVAKDDMVKPEQVIAKTNISLKKESIGKVYFEIRNKNKVQNTIKLVKLDNNKV